MAGAGPSDPESEESRTRITFRDLELDVHRAEVVAPEGTWGWFGERERAEMPLSSLVTKVLRADRLTQEKAPLGGQQAATPTSSWATARISGNRLP